MVVEVVVDAVACGGGVAAAVLVSAAVVVAAAAAVPLQAMVDWVVFDSVPSLVWAPMDTCLEHLLS